MKNAALQHAIQVESEFLAGVQANLSQFGARVLRGSRFVRGEEEETGAVRALLIDRDIQDRSLERQFPGRRTVVWKGMERAFIFFSREASRTLATVIAPPEATLDADGATARPVTLAEVREHVRKRVGGSRTPTLVAVCSPSGFDPAVWDATWEQPGLRVVLVAPNDDGAGWRVRPTWQGADERLTRLFDPEGAADKLKRIRAVLEQRSGDLLIGGISVEELAMSLNLPRPMVEQGVLAVCRQDPELKVSRRSGETLVFRGAAEDGQPEVSAMSVTEWIRSLFSRGGDEARKINLLSEKRAALSQRRDRLYDDIAKLETKEGGLVEEGKKNPSAVVRRRLAAQIAQVRRDISRANTTAAMLNQQINVISTHIHNLTLIQQGELAQLPTSEELTEDAVKAEELLETLRADAELVGGLETGTAEAMLTTEEADILKEFEQSDSAQAAPAGRSTAGPQSEPPLRTASRAPAARGPESAPPPGETPSRAAERKERAGPAAE